jgi:hypothetical protein
MEEMVGQEIDIEASKDPITNLEQDDKGYYSVHVKKSINSTR